MRRLKALFSVSPASLTLGTICVVVGLYVYGVPLLDLIELKTYDLRFVPRGHVPPSPAVVIAAIDERSLNAEGRWPWPRSKLAALVDILSQDSARVIGIDIVFSEPDENSQLTLIQQFSQKVEALAIKDPQLMDFIQESHTNADNDLALANAIKNASATVVLVCWIHEISCRTARSRRSVAHEMKRECNAPEAKTRIVISSSASAPWRRIRI